MAQEPMIPARAVVRLLERAAGGPWPDPWCPQRFAVQPLPGEVQASRLADLYIQEITNLQQHAILHGSEVAERAVQRVQRLTDDIEELCPRWPRPPFPWPEPWWDRPGEMTKMELLAFGSRLLAASAQVEPGPIQDALAGVGSKVVALSLEG